jgi:hypothetical protein
MKATINGISVDGTPAEVLEFYRITRDQGPQIKVPKQQIDVQPNPWIKNEIGGYAWNGPADSKYARYDVIGKTGLYSEGKAGEVNE